MPIKVNDNLSAIAQLQEEGIFTMTEQRANTLLSPDEKKIATNIYRILLESKDLGLNVRDTQDWVINHINETDGLEMEYYSIVDGDTLADISNWEDALHVVGCITVYCGKTPIRLIDHIRYK